MSFRFIQLLVVVAGNRSNKSSCVSQCQAPFHHGLTRWSALPPLESSITPAHHQWPRMNCELAQHKARLGAARGDGWPSSSSETLTRRQPPPPESTTPNGRQLDLLWSERARLTWQGFLSSEMQRAANKSRPTLKNTTKQQWQQVGIGGGSSRKTRRQHRRHHSGGGRGHFFTPCPSPSSTRRNFERSDKLDGDEMATI